MLRTAVREAATQLRQCPPGRDGSPVICDSPPTTLNSARTLAVRLTPRGSSNRGVTRPTSGTRRKCGLGRSAMGLSN